MTNTRKPLDPRPTLDSLAQTVRTLECAKDAAWDVSYDAEKAAIEASEHHATALKALQDALKERHGIGVHGGELV